MAQTDDNQKVGPPPPNARSKWDQRFEVMKDNPRVWYSWGYNSQSSGFSAGSQAIETHVPGAFEMTSRSEEDGAGRLYMRYVGGDTND